MSAPRFDKKNLVTTAGFDLVYELAKAKNSKSISSILCLDVYCGNFTPISLLASEGDLDSVKFLLAHGANIEEAAYGAAIEGDTKFLAELLLKDDKCINAALKGAALIGNRILLVKLVNQGANLNLALQSAAKGGMNLSLSKELLALTTATYLDKKRATLEAGTPLADELASKKSGLDGAVIGAAFNGDRLLVEDYLKRGANIDSAISGAAMGGHIFLLEDLLTRQPASEFVDRINSAVDDAASNGHKNIVYTLLEHGADINNALGGAASGGHADLVNELLKRGADIDVAAINAAEGPHPKLIDDLIKRGASINEVAWSLADAGHVKLLEKYLRLGAKIEDAVKGAIDADELSTEKEEKVLKFLSLFDDEKIRIRFAENARPQVKSILHLLKPAAQINKIMKEKDLNFNQALALINPAVIGLINHQSQVNFLIPNLTALVATYLTPINHINTVDLFANHVETAHLMVEKAEIMQATKLAAEEKKLSKFWSKSESTRLSKLEKKESIRSTNTFFWSQSVPDEDSARKKNLQQLDKNFQKIPATERNKITSRKARLK